LAQVEAAKVERSEVQKTGQAEEYQLKVSKAIATKSARIQVLEDEIRSLESDVEREENKKYNRPQYYRDGRWVYGPGGISRAPEFRKKLEAKRQEYGVLKQQVATLEVELESMR
jgi:cell division protein FtsB